MDYSVLEKSCIFKNIPEKELRENLEAVPHHIQCYTKDETILHLMEDATRIGIILEVESDGIIKYESHFIEITDSDLLQDVLAI